MRFRERDQSSIRSYQRISLEKRKRLVQMTMNEGFSLSKVAKKLNLKLTTARLILKKYRQTGDFSLRNFRKKVPKTQKTQVPVQIKEEKVQQQSSVLKEKQYQQPEIVYEEAPMFLYYFVNEMPALTCFPPFWPSPLPWL